MAVVTGLGVLLFAGIAGATEKESPYVDTVSEPLTVRTGPGTNFPAAGRELPDGTTVRITCQVEGTQVSGKLGTSRLWDKLADGGYVSDAYVYTGSDGRIAPTCEATEPAPPSPEPPPTSADSPPGQTDTPAPANPAADSAEPAQASEPADHAEPAAPYVDTVSEPLTVRTGPGTNFPAAGRELPDGTTVRITCQVEGTQVSGKLGTSRLWDKLADGGYVSDAYVYTGSDGRIAPTCDPIDTPAGGQPEDVAPLEGAASLIPVPTSNDSEQPLPSPGPTPSPQPGPPPVPPTGDGTAPNPGSSEWVHENLTPKQLADRFLWRHQGGRYKFYDGDTVTEQLREHDDWLRDITWQLQNNELPLTGSLHKSLLNPDDMFQAAIRDPLNIGGYLLRMDRADAAVTYLGSYSLRYKAEMLDGMRLRITYDIYNETDGESATRIPIVGYLPQVPLSGMWLKDKAANLMLPKQEQWVHLTMEVPAVYPLSCEVSGSRCWPSPSPVA